MSNHNDDMLPVHVNINVNNALNLECFDIPPHYKNDLESVLIPHGLILDRISKIAHDIIENNNEQSLLFICVLKGGFQFFSNLLDVVKKLVISTNKPVQISFEFVRLKSYTNDKSTGSVQISGMDLSTIQGKNIIIVEDIVDTGKSAVALTEEIKKYNPNSVKFVTLLVKKTPKRNDFKPDHVGFLIPDYFVVGYALDYNEYFRDLDHICIIKESGIDKYKV